MMGIYNPKRGREHFPSYAYLLREGRLRRNSPEKRKELIEYYKSQNPEDYEKYVRWCKLREKSTGKKYIH
ncbi:MAG: hypothetical protein IKT40_13390 [Bacilli bacterium]|nr:hypothetical protein [Bacilli bacterium]